MDCGCQLAPMQVEGKERLKCPSCGWVYWEDPKLAVAVLVARDRSVLLGRRGHDPGRGLWSFPAGFVDRGERVEDAAVREVREETGLEVRLGSLLMLRSEPGKTVVLAVYSGEAVHGDPVPGDELTELRWFGPDEAPPMAFAHDAEVLRTWIAALEERGCER